MSGVLYDDTLDFTDDVSGDVMGWMIAWGVWVDERPRRTAAQSNMWLPSATGRTLHQVAEGTFNDLDDDRPTMISCCRSGGNDVRLLLKKPWSPGDVFDRWYFLTSPGELTTWLKVSAALREFSRLCYHATGEQRHHYAAVNKARDVVRGVSRGEYHRCVLAGLGDRWQMMPEEERYLLPWLITAAANGITGHCVRCADPTWPM